MAKKAEPSPQHMIRVAIDLAAERGWNALSLGEVAAAAGVPMTELYRHFPSKAGLLAGFSRLVDEEMLAESVDEESSPRDRLFDLMMRRFDALNAHRGGVKAVLRDLSCDPLGALAHQGQVERSMRWTLEAAGLSASGLFGMLKVRALGLIYLNVLRIWARDESEDMSRTMAALDRSLRQAEQFANTFGRRPRRGGDEGRDDDRDKDGDTDPDLDGTDRA